MPVICTVRCEMNRPSALYVDPPKTCLREAAIYRRESLPPTWISVQIQSRSLEPYTFCSLLCLALWAAPHAVTDPTPLVGDEPEALADAHPSRPSWSTGGA